MKAEIKTKWVAALRSGKYRQGKGKLVQEHTDEETEYCCLGVLCEIAVEDGIIAPREYNGFSFIYGKQDDDGDYSSDFLPRTVQKWAGLDCNSPGFTDDQDYHRTLIGMNDDREDDFATIADAIEENF